MFYNGRSREFEEIIQIFFQEKDFPPGGEHRKHLGELEQQRHLDKMARADG